MSILRTNGWLVSRQKRTTPWVRCRAEAAILEAKGGLRRRAVGKLAEVESAILHQLPKERPPRDASAIAAPLEVRPLPLLSRKSETLPYRKPAVDSTGSPCCRLSVAHSIDQREKRSPGGAAQSLFERLVLEKWPRRNPLSRALKPWEQRQHVAAIDPTPARVVPDS